MVSAMLRSCVLVSMLTIGLVLHGCDQECTVLVRDAHHSVIDNAATPPAECSGNTKGFPIPPNSCWHVVTAGQQFPMDKYPLILRIQDTFNHVNMESGTLSIDAEDKSLAGLYKYHCHNVPFTIEGNDMTVNFDKADNATACGALSGQFEFRNFKWCPEQQTVQFEMKAIFSDPDNWITGYPFTLTECGDIFSCTFMGTSSCCEAAQSHQPWSHRIDTVLFGDLVGNCTDGDLDSIANDLQCKLNSNTCSNDKDSTRFAENCEADIQASSKGCVGMTGNMDVPCVVDNVIAMGYSASCAATIADLAECGGDVTLRICMLQTHECGMSTDALDEEDCQKCIQREMIKACVPPFEAVSGIEACPPKDFGADFLAAPVPMAAYAAGLPLFDTRRAAPASLLLGFGVIAAVASGVMLRRRLRNAHVAVAANDEGEPMVLQGDLD